MHRAIVVDNIVQSASVRLIKIIPYLLNIFLLALLVISDYPAGKSLYGSTIECSDFASV